MVRWQNDRYALKMSEEIARTILPSTWPQNSSSSSIKKFQISQPKTNPSASTESSKPLNHHHQSITNPIIVKTKPIQSTQPIKSNNIKPPINQNIYKEPKFSNNQTRDNYIYKIFFLKKKKKTETFKVSVKPLNGY